MSNQMEPKGNPALDDAFRVIETMLKGFVAGGAAGAGWGATLALLRGERIGFYAGSIGANFALTTASYVTFHEIIAHRRGKKDIVTYVLPGTITGAGLLGLVGSPLRALQGSLAGSAIGAGIFFGHKYFNNWRHEVAVQRYITKYGHDSLPVDLQIQHDPVEKIDLPSIIPSFVNISDEEIEERIQARIDQLRQEQISNDESK